MEIAPGVHQIDRLRAANVFLIVEEHLTLVDTGTKGSKGAILRYIEGLGRAPSELRRIILTHHHFDHAGSLAFLKTRTGALAGAHPLDRDVIEGKEAPPPFHMPFLQRLLFALPAQLMKASPASVDFEVVDGDVLDILGGLQVVHTPGHTPGSISLLLKEQGILFVGDVVTNSGGQLTGPSLTFSADPALAYESVRKIAALDFETCCVSHGEVIKLGAAKRVRELAGTL